MLVHAALTSFLARAGCLTERVLPAALCAVSASVPAPTGVCAVS
jgi:hypothetical protein